MLNFSKTRTIVKVEDPVLKILKIGLVNAAFVDASFVEKNVENT